MSRLHSASKRGDVDAVRRLLKNSDISVNDRDVSGNTPLHIACQLGHLDVVNLILETEMDVNVNAKNSDGKEAIDLARANNHTEVIEAFRNAACLGETGQESSGLQHSENKGVEQGGGMPIGGLVGGMEKLYSAAQHREHQQQQADEPASTDTLPAISPNSIPDTSQVREVEATQAGVPELWDLKSSEVIAGATTAGSTGGEVKKEETWSSWLMSSTRTFGGDEEAGWGTKGAPLVYTEEQWRTRQVEYQMRVDATSMDYKKKMELQEAAHQRKLDLQRAELTEKIEKAEVKLALARQEYAARVGVVEESEDEYRNKLQESREEYKAKLETAQEDYETRLETTRKEYDDRANSAKQELEVLKEEHKAQLEAVHAECDKKVASFKEEMDSGFEHLKTSSEAIRANLQADLIRVTAELRHAEELNSSLESQLKSTEDHLTSQLRDTQTRLDSALAWKESMEAELNLRNNSGAEAVESFAQRQKDQDALVISLKDDLRMSVAELDLLKGQDTFVKKKLEKEKKKLADELEEVKRQAQKELDDTVQQWTMILNETEIKAQAEIAELKRDSHTKLEAMRKDCDEKVGESRKSIPEKLADERRLTADKLLDQDRKHSIKLEEVEQQWNGKLVEAERQYFRKLAEKEREAQQHEEEQYREWQDEMKKVRREWQQRAEEVEREAALKMEEMKQDCDQKVREAERAAYDKGNLVALSGEERVEALMAAEKAAWEKMATMERELRFELDRRNKEWSDKLSEAERLSSEKLSQCERDARVRLEALQRDWAGKLEESESTAAEKIAQATAAKQQDMQEWSERLSQAEQSSLAKLLETEQQARNQQEDTLREWSTKLQEAERSARETIQTLESEAQVQELKVKELTRQVEDLNVKLVTSNHSLTDIEATQSKSAAENKRLSMRLESSEAALETARRQVAVLAGQVACTDPAAQTVAQQMDIEREKVAQTTRQQEELKRQIAQSENEKKQALSEVSTLRSSLSENQSRLMELEREKSQLAIASLEQKMYTERYLKDAQDTQTLLERERASHQEALEDLRTQHDRMYQERQAMLERLSQENRTELERARQTAQEEQAKIQRELSDLRAQYDALKYEKQEAALELKAAMESGQRDSAHFKQLAEVAQQMEAAAKERLDQRLAVENKLKEQITELQHEIADKNAHISEMNSERKELATQLGAEFSQGGQIATEIDRLKLEHRQSMSAALEKDKRNTLTINQLEASVEKWTAKAESSAKELALTDEKLREAQSQFWKLKDTIISLEKQNKELEETIGKTKEVEDQARVQYEQLEGELKKQVGDYIESMATNEKLTLAAEQHEKEVQLLKNEISFSASQISMLSEQNEALETKVAAGSSQLTDVTTDVEKSAKTIADLESKIAGLQTVEATNKEVVKNLEDRLKESQTLTDSLTSELAVAKSRLLAAQSDLQSQADKHKQDLMDLNIKHKDWENKAEASEALRQAVAEAQATESKLRAEIEIANMNHHNDQEHAKKELDMLMRQLEDEKKNAETKMGVIEMKTQADVEQMSSELDKMNAEKDNLERTLKEKTLSEAKNEKDIEEFKEEIKKVRAELAKATQDMQDETLKVASLFQRYEEEEQKCLELTAKLDKACLENKQAQDQTQELKMQFRLDQKLTGNEIVTEIAAQMQVLKDQLWDANMESKAKLESVTQDLTSEFATEMASVTDLHAKEMKALEARYRQILNMPEDKRGSVGMQVLLAEANHQAKLQQVTATHEAQMEDMRKRLVKENDAWIAKMNEMKLKHESQDQGVKEEQVAMSDHLAQMEALTQELSSQFTLAMTSMTQDHAKEMEAVKAKNKQPINTTNITAGSTLETEQTYQANQPQLKEMGTAKDPSNAESLVVQQMHEIQKLKEEHDQQMLMATDLFAAEMDELKLGHESEIKMLQEKHEASVHSAVQKEKIAALVKAEEDHVAKLQQLMQEHKQEMRMAKDAFNAELEEVKLQHQIETQQLKVEENLQAELQSLKEEHDREMAKEQDAFSTAMDDLMLKFEASEQELQKQYEDQLNEELTKTMRQMTALHQEDLLTLENLLISLGKGELVKQKVKERAMRLEQINKFKQEHNKELMRLNDAENSAVAVEQEDELPKTTSSSSWGWGLLG